MTAKTMRRLLPVAESGTPHNGTAGVPRRRHSDENTNRGAPRRRSRPRPPPQPTSRGNSTGADCPSTERLLDPHRPDMASVSPNRLPVGGQWNLPTGGHMGLPVCGHGVVERSLVAMGDTSGEPNPRHLQGAPLGSEPRVIAARYRLPTPAGNAGSARVVLIRPPGIIRESTTATEPAIPDATVRHYRRRYRMPPPCTSGAPRRWRDDGADDGHWLRSRRAARWSVVLLVGFEFDVGGQVVVVVRVGGGGGDRRGVVGLAAACASTAV
jgi:hypothetical protein